MFTTNDYLKWLIVAKDEIIWPDHSYETKNLLRSSESPNAPTTSIDNRNNRDKDPSVSLIDEFSTLHRADFSTGHTEFFK